MGKFKDGYDDAREGKDLNSQGIFESDEDFVRRQAGFKEGERDRARDDWETEQEYKRDRESSNDSSGWDNISRSKPNEFGKFLMVCFWGTIALFWCWAFYLSFRYDNETAQYIINKTLSSLWSPTRDQVLNFLIDTILVVVGIAMAIGVISSGFLILIVLFCIVIAFFVIGALVALAKVSVTGTIVASIIGLAILYYGSRYLLQKFPKILSN